MGSSTSKIAKRAGVSAGTLYIYYPDKESLFQQIYMELKTEFHTKLMEAGSQQTEPIEALRHMWHAMCDIAREDPHAYMFVEIITTANLLSEDLSRETARMAEETHAFIKAALPDEMANSLDMKAAELLLIAPASLLARWITRRPDAISSELIDATFNLTWQGLQSLNK